MMREECVLRGGIVISERDALEHEMAEHDEGLAAAWIGLMERVGPTGDSAKDEELGPLDRELTEALLEAENALYCDWVGLLDVALGHKHGFCRACADGEVFDDLEKGIVSCRALLVSVGMEVPDRGDWPRERYECLLPEDVVYFGALPAERDVDRIVEVEGRSYRRRWGGAASRVT